MKELDGSGLVVGQAGWYDSSQLQMCILPIQTKKHIRIDGFINEWGYTQVLFSRESRVAFRFAALIDVGRADSDDRAR